ncbi:stage II sporulation protein E [Clostridium fallax]|uniref:Stage II sporulation protein E n=1 Tax=Clostridium fallax TaxID=1533 RepID=A0A1M4TFI1_9CLOT|nr:stage II sporulation protein E [Clostridium fallax]SHE43047.1 stage II sporulation protein E [Clostridium fallax]SQB22730.1 stage II sprulation protein E [Clostridium fallax]
MQYGVDVSTYKRTDDKNKTQRNKTKVLASPIRIVFSFIGAIFISRVAITVNIDTFENIAPFGIAYILAYSNRRDKKESLIAAVGVLLGYITMFNRLEDLPMYILIVAAVVIFQNIPIRLHSKLFEYSSFFVIFISMFLFRAIINNYSFWVNIVTSIIQTVVIYPIYYMIKYAVSCIDDMNTNHYYTSEEIVSISLLVCLIISGVGDLGVLGVSFRNIVSLVFIISIGYISGTSIGAAAGISLGMIVGISTNNMMLYISVYGICGLVVGIFKDTGKILSLISYLIMYFILIMYSKNFEAFRIIEAVLACGIFVLIPSSLYNKLSLEFDSEKKQDKLGELHFNKIKEEFSVKLNNFTEVLSCISVVLNKLVDNDKLLLKNKGTAMIENLADRVCGSCDMKQMCWKREIHATYEAFGELIRNQQEGRRDFPEILRKKCMREHALIKQAEEIVNNHVMNEMVRKRMSEGRKLLSGHINNMAITIGEIADDFNKDINICSDVERAIKKELIKNNFPYENILCFEDKHGRINIKVIMDNCHGEQKCVKDLLPIINNSIGRNMSIGGEGCNIDPKTRNCTVLIEEAPKYHISSNVSLACKDGEKYTGDSYSFGKGKEGNYMAVLSDGMGSGPEAGAESKAAVELIEKFTQAGFEDLTAINTVNSIMTMKFSEDEKFATLDMYNIDLYTGKTTFMKVGAVESFIKRGDKIFVIESNTLPFGVLDKPDIDITDKKVVNGDIIVTISDGVLDVGEDRGANYKWIIEFLRESKIKNPKELSADILNKAIELNGGKSKDDMTVMVSKVYALY